MRSSAINKYYRLSWQEKLLLGEALFFLFVTKLLVLFVPFKTLAPYFGKINQTAGGKIEALDEARATFVQKTINMASANVPWKSVCLDRALAAMVMLNRRQIPNTLYLGVKFNDSKGKLNAHAWVECNDRILVGGSRSKYYKVVAFFSRF